VAGSALKKRQPNLKTKKSHHQLFESRTATSLSFSTAPKPTHALTILQGDFCSLRYQSLLITGAHFFRGGCN